MSQTKISLMEMAEAVGDAARTARGHVERWDRDHPNSPLAPSDGWVMDARRFENAQLTLSLMALDENASREFIASLIKKHGHDARVLVGMLTPRAAPAPKEAEAA